MIGLKVASFFDSAEVLAAVDPATRKALSRSGAFVRRTARGLIRKRKAVSKPDTPPTDRGGALKRLLFFGYDRQTSSVVIGPALFAARKSPAPKEPPTLALEAGGFVYRYRRDRLESSPLAPRPYMGPALAKNLSALPTYWKDVIR